MYDLKELEAFVSVVKTGSLTASTRDLDLPKSTLSRRIRQLEEAVGQPLLLRQSKRIFPNDAGRVFYRYSNEILELVSQGFDALDELRAGVSGTLELFCHEAFVRGWFARMVERFRDQHAGLSVSVRTQRAVPEELVEGVCVWLGTPPEGNFRCELLGHLTQGVYGSREYFSKHGCPESPADLDTHAWIDMLGADNAGVVLNHPVHGSYPIMPRAGRFSVDQYTVQGDAIAAGRGVGLIPHWLAEKRLQAHPGAFELCMADWQGPVLPVSMLYPHGILPRRTRLFMQNVRSATPAQWKRQTMSGESDAIVP
ncbi:LysR family transcriptional regulator [Marinobacter sp. M1N3S26]|uniref:LysR family transcriptional regulator n=1 Tax=unclassified Marinobacter TaxID=83889 RepID=UPI00387AFC0B